MGKYFGTDGVRGRATERFQPEFVFRLGIAAATILAGKAGSSRPHILIGKDTRISGDYIESALAAGMAAGGCDVTLLGVIPTPGVAVMTGLLQADASAVISASHNPYYDNGIKFFDACGYKLPDQVEEEIERFIDSGEQLPLASDDDLGHIDFYPNAAGEYAAWLQEAQSPDLRGLKIVVDTANGAASAIAGPLLESLGGAVVCMANKPDGCNINLDCGSTHMEALCKAVVAEHADLGIAFDGDADRMLAVDENGNIVDGDQILAILARDMKEKGELAENELVITIMNNMGLRLAMEELGATVYETKVGDRYVLERMLQSGASIGGEQSGHIILRQYNSTGDGEAAALRLLTVMQESGKPLSQLAGIMKKLPQCLINPRVKDKESWRTDAEIQQKIKDYTSKLAGRGRIVIRPSGTEPLIRVMTEGEDKELICHIAQELAELIGRKMS